MSNSYFHFKQFSIHQDRCAMKVCTDSCLFGALMKVPQQGKILDIGCGTGLLSLMAAQESEAEVHAIETDKAASEQAQENFNATDWRGRLFLINDDIKNSFSAIYQSKYDCIISNPPFFENHLLPGDEAKTKAKHSTELTYDELLSAVGTLLKKNGVFNVLLPFISAQLFIEKAARKGLKPAEHIQLKNYSSSQPFRSVLIFDYESSKTKTGELIIYQSPNTYSKAAHKLLAPFYKSL